MTPEPLALYIHWPFCKAKCPYCDFNSHVRGGIDQPRWRAALSRELGSALEGLEGRPLASIFFGGGTPSLMDPATAGALIEQAAARLAPTEDLEITLEANPTSVEAGRFADYRAAGVNRLSLGVQSLDEEALRFLGREHDVAEARAAIDLAATHFPRRSFDLIYGRRGQSLDAWEAELERAVALAADHLSLYQLTIEPGTRFFTRTSLGETLTADETVAAEQYEATQDRLESLGLPAYEISNHARPGSESRHNLVYWRYGDYVGIGPGAHGRETRGGVARATTRVRLPERWIEAVERDGHALERTETLTDDRRFREAMMMGLRLRDGVSDRRLKARTGMGLDDLEADRIDALVDEGYLSRSEEGLAATSAGRARLDAVLAYLL